MILLYIISAYLLVGCLIGYSSFRADLRLNQLLPLKEYYGRQVLFWLVDLVNQTFFDYDNEDGDGLC